MYFFIIYWGNEISILVITKDKMFLNVRIKSIVSLNQEFKIYFNSNIILINRLNCHEFSIIVNLIISE